MAQGRTTRRCGCTYVDPDTGKRKQYGDACPKLRRKDGSWDTRHGTWYAIYPVVVRGKRRTITRGGFESKADAHAHMEASRAKVAKGVDLSRERITVEQFFTEWLAGKVDIRRTTLRSYTGHVARYVVPYMGWIRLSDLRASHVSECLSHVKASPATKQRVRATIRSGLADAVRQGLLPDNPARHVKIESARRVRATVWTPTLIEDWKRTGVKPSPTMIWTPEMTGEWLDAVADDRLYAMWHLLAYRGLRRGEAIGTAWSDLDLDGPHPALIVRTAITSVKGKLYEGPPKSDAGDRVIPLDPGTCRVLTAHRHAQRLERMRAGARWVDTGKAFTTPLGTWLDPNRDVTKRFARLIEESGLPSIKLHGLRHGAASLTLLATGGDMKAAQVLLGHSNASMTAQVYAHLYPEQQRASAAAVASIVPRAVR